ncbi:hypothetical protein PUN28_014148 [Cardiocondyla obscurior]|uniref:Gustatory receptor n=1 Tax=Cardiocondyla obscurior TaxID=286306 RepID=A0AAW2F2W5_9HYME
MSSGIRIVLKPILIINYVFGLRIAGLSSCSKLWFNVLYILLLWSIYFNFLPSVISIYYKYHSPIEDRVFYVYEICTTLVSIAINIYYNTKFQNCLRKLDIVDNTLLKLGLITNYDKPCNKTVWFILGWFVMVMLTNCSTSLYMKNELNYNLKSALIYIFAMNHCFHVNFIGDLTTASILQFIGLKFDQINEYLQNTMKYKQRKRASRNQITYSHQRNISKACSNKCIMWTITHLHVELHKIFREIDLIFGTQMTFKMAIYFGWIVVDLREILNALFINNYVKYNIMAICSYCSWLIHNVFKFLLINYICETVVIKILQLSLRTVHAPFRFCGIGFFQFGFKFFCRFMMSVATVLVIIIQAQKTKHSSFSNDNNN